MKYTLQAEPLNYMAAVVQNYSNRKHTQAKTFQLGGGGGGGGAGELAFSFLASYFAAIRLLLYSTLINLTYAMK